jgi:hypothetical protein
MNPETALPNPIGEAISQAPAQAPVIDFTAAVTEMQKRAETGQLSPKGQAAWEELKRRRGIQTQATPDSQTPTQNTGDFRLVGVGATGFNKGLGSFVDLFNHGLKELGVPTSDEPFMGSAFIDKYLGGSEFMPQNAFEHVVARAGFEVGANAPLLAGALEVRGANMGKELVQSGTQALAQSPDAGMLERNVRAVRAIPEMIIQQMQDVSPMKLAAFETAIAAGAGTVADIVHQVFPEGGATAEFFGELAGSFAPSVVLGLVQKARAVGGAMVHAARAVVGLETEQETKARLQSKLKDAAKPEEIQAGVKRADELKEEVSPGSIKGEGLNLSAGEAIGGATSGVQRALERRGEQAFRAKAIETRRQNIEAVKGYFDATAPEGNPTRLIEHLESQRNTNQALLQEGLARTEAKLDAVKNTISVRKANLLNDMEARMFAADQRVEARLQSIGSSLSAKERGELIRQEYEAELVAFRERSKADYHELDMLGHAELPVGNTLQKYLQLQADFPDHIQIIRKINPRLANALDNLGHDYELQMRAQKALDDLGMRDASGKGQRVFLEQQGTGSSPEVRGLSRGTPNWYRDLTLRESPLSRQSIESRLTKWANGTKLNPHDPLDEEVRKSLLLDNEFYKSPYNEPVVQQLGRDTPSASLKDLRQVRSDLLTLSRQAKSSDNRVQRYMLQELVSGVDGDIDQLLPGQSTFAGIYPEHGVLYRQVSADYRTGVETLLKGTANRIRLTNRYGDYTTYDESIPALFFRNETTMQDFDKAFTNRDVAKMALRDYALEDFSRTVIHKKGDQWVMSQPAYEQWMVDHAAHLKSFPDLQASFANTRQVMQEAADLRAQVEVFQQGKRGEEALLRRLHAERRPGDLTTNDVSFQEARLKHKQEILDRSQQDWEHSLAGTFLRENPNYAAQRLVTSKDPMVEYERLHAMVAKDPDAVAGLNKAIWNALTDKIQPKLTGMTGEMNLGVFHRELQQWIYGNEGLMTKVLGPEAMGRIKTTSEVVEKIARGGKENSDTAINLQVQAALASTWMSRGFAVASGRVSHWFAGAERVGQYLTKYFQGMTQKQQEAILLESFFDPHVYETLVLAGTYGPENRLVKYRTIGHLNLLNLSEQTSDKATP